MFQIMTMNIRYPAPSDGEYYFPFRLPYIVEEVKSLRPDVLCFQEMLPFMYEALSSMLPEYAFIGIGRGQELDGESCRIAYLKDSLTLCATDTFWLSPTPDVPGSRYQDQSICPRICTWGKFYHIANHSMLYVLNTHLDHEGDGARRDGLSQILEKAHELLERQSLPLFITGDFNFTPSDPAYEMIEDAPFEDLTAQLSGSFHAYGRESNTKIDYILTNQPKEEFEIKLLHTGSNGKFLSDHDFICARWNRI